MGCAVRQRLTGDGKEWIEADRQAQQSSPYIHVVSLCSAGIPRANAAQHSASP
jgi:hypothetical protein